MTFIEAIKTGQPLTRRNKSWTFATYMMMGMSKVYTTITPGTFINPNFFLEVVKLTQKDILADDWIVQETLTMETV